jgi:hypothetical protein
MLDRLLRFLPRPGPRALLAVPVGLARLLFLSRTPCSRPLPAGTPLALTAAVTVLALVIDGHVLRDYTQPVPNDGHAMNSLELAINRAETGSISDIDARKAAGEAAGICALLPDNAAMLAEPLRALPDRLAGSREEYARGLRPWLQNENSLMLLDYGLLRLAPGLTLRGLIRAHLLVKIGCLAAFTFFLLRLGASPAAALVAFHLGLLITAKVNETHPVSVYSLLLPVVLLLAAALGLGLSFGAHRRLRYAVPALAGAGLLGAFLVNLRTSYLPVLAALVLTYAACAAARLGGGAAGSRLRRAALAGLPLLAFLGGYRAFTATLIDPVVRHTASCDSKFSYHVVALPLVLCLSVPPCELARREGIRYDDPCGLTLARRLDPTVTYLGPRYDRALFAYYVKLWLLSPGQMRDVYAAKLRLAGADAFRYLDGLAADEPLRRAGHLTAAPLRPLASPGGAAYLALFAAALLAAWAVGRRLDPATAFALAALGVTGGLLLTESAVLFSAFHLPYHGPLLFLMGCVGLLAYQGAADGAAWLVARAARLGRLAEAVAPPAG